MTSFYLDVDGPLIEFINSLLKLHSCANVMLLLDKYSTTFGFR
jgi:hypothetical protein